MQNKPFCQAADNNKAPIANILKHYLIGSGTVLEIGSGTGQHVRYFSDIFPNITWQPSDLLEQHPSIECWAADYLHASILPPLLLDMRDETKWPRHRCYTAVYTANTAHIMAWSTVNNMMRLCAIVLNPGSFFFCYGPFNDKGKYTSEGNALFDRSLRSHNPESGLRDLEAMTTIAEEQNLSLEQAYTMPANNYLLVFKKK